jgi:hypothetical protein
MSDDSKKGEQEEQHQLPPPPPPVTDNEDKKKNGESGSDDDPKEKTSRFQFPQPFIVKEDKENKKGLRKLKTSEIISLIALCVSIYAVLLNKCSLDNTTKSLAINDSTFKRNNIKDSLTSASNRYKDSVNRIKDSITIELAKKSLEEQITSFTEERARFTIENRGYVEVANISFDSTLAKTPFIIEYTIENVGKFPIVVKYRKVGLAMGTGSSIRQVISQLDKDNNWEITRSNDAVSNSSHLKCSQIIKIDIPKYYKDAFRSGNAIFYFIIEIHYKSYGVEKMYKMNLTYRIRIDKQSHIINFDSAEYSDSEIPN